MSCRVFYYISYFVFFFNTVITYIICKVGLYIYIYIYISGGPLSALTCCVNVRFLSGGKKNIAVNLFSKVGLGAGSILRKL